MASLLLELPSATIQALAGGVAMAGGGGALAESVAVVLARGVLGSVAASGGLDPRRDPWAMWRSRRERVEAWLPEARGVLLSGPG